MTKRIAIIGGGISGLTAAYELELARKRGADIDWHLYEASDRLGGIVETTRHTTPEGEWILEGGPDAWVSEKPWARELAIELGLEDQLIYSNDADKKTYIYIDGILQAMPDGMRMFVPQDLSTLDSSPLFSTSAKQAYAAEVERAEELKASSPKDDESVASFVRRHFGDEVLEKVAAPLLSGIFGGDVYKLSSRSVLAPFVKMEQEHGSLVLALQRRAAERGEKKPQPTFTSLCRGMESLVEAIIEQLPSDRLHRQLDSWPAEDGGWAVMAGNPYKSFLGLLTTIATRSEKDLAEGFDEIVLATPLEVTKTFAGPAGFPFAEFLPTHASSALLVTFCWPADVASTFNIPQGFGFLVPQDHTRTSERGILAATFTNQKFSHRTPLGARAIRVYFGANSTEHFAQTSDQQIAKLAFAALQTILGPLPDSEQNLTTVHRWPHSLPQYEVGHLDRMAKLDESISRLPGLHLLGSSYRGVGLPDLIHAARETARKVIL